MMFSMDKCHHRGRSLSRNSVEYEKSCRLCLSSHSSTSSRNPLISPCECRGTAAYIHVNCLEKWQDSVYPFTRGLYCSVCKSKIRHNNWRLTAKIYLGSKIVSFCTTIATIGWVLYTLFFMIPVRVFLQASLVVLSNWLPKEGIEIDDMQLRWVWDKGTRRLALLKKSKPKIAVNDTDIVKPGYILLAANHERRTSSQFFVPKSVILITKHADSGTEGILINGRSSRLNDANDSDSMIYSNNEENYISILFTIEDGGATPSGYNILHNNSKVSGAVRLADGLYINEAGKINEKHLKVGQEDMRRFKTLVDAIDTPSGVAARKIKIFKNVCSWKPGELETEINSGNIWFVISSRRETNFKIGKYILSSHKNLYDKLVEKLQLEDDVDDGN